MRTEIFVQARMGSTRLPGKVMKQVLGRPLLDFEMERLKVVREADDIMILTTTSSLDEEIVKFCKERKISCFRGSEEDVLDRYYQAALIRKPDLIVRITADCPLIDPEIVDEVIHFYQAHKFDYVSNSLERTYPRGLDVEVFSFLALEKAWKEGKREEEREHVTPYLYHHPELFKLGNKALPISQAQHRWTVDTEEDFILVKAILQNLYPSNPHFRMKDVLALLDQHPELAKINAHVKQKKLSQM